MSTSQLALFDLPQVVVPDRIGTAAVRAVESTHVLTKGVGRTADYDFTLNAYRGCSFGCSYCYAPFFLADEQLRESWGEWVEAKTKAVGELHRHDLYNKRIYMSSVTDPYQPVERELELTRSIVETLAAKGARLVVQTRSPLAARDADLFGRFKHIRVNMSITTDDDEVRKRFEPGCASIERRMDAVAALVQAGIRVHVCVSPMLPMKDPATFAQRLEAIGVYRAYASWFHDADRPFAASTRDPARRLLATIGWNRESFESVYAQLKAHSAIFNRPRLGLSPI
jgi:DNA repair photolyase